MNTEINLLGRYQGMSGRGNLGEWRRVPFDRNSEDFDGSKRTCGGRKWKVGRMWDPSELLLTEWRTNESGSDGGPHDLE